MLKGFTLIESLIGMIITAISFAALSMICIALSPAKIKSNHQKRVMLYNKMLDNKNSGKNSKQTQSAVIFEDYYLDSVKHDVFFTSVANE